MSVRARIRLPAGGNKSKAITVTTDEQDRKVAADVFPAKEWSIVDDILNVADTASVSIANNDGENSGKIQLGQRIEIDSSDSEVQNGRWTPHFTGRVTGLETYSDISGGSNILITAMDLGWHLTSSHARPQVSLKGIKFQKLLEILIDSSWGFGEIQSDNSTNRNIKLGRKVIQQNFAPVLGGILPRIQIEIGQTPYDLIKQYAAREGLLVNVGAQGELVFFRPRYTDPAQYTVEYHGSREDQRSKNNVIGRPGKNERIDGLYSQVECWSTVVIPPSISNTENPLEMSRHETITPENPLPFKRRHAFSDTEAITPTLLRNRATWKQQMDAFNSWTYECEFNVHSQNGFFFVSDTMISINDTVNKIEPASYYVQSVRRSLTLRDGVRTKLTIRKPLLNPELQALPASPRKAAKTKTPTK